MIYKIRHMDGDIYEFRNVKELLEALCKALSPEHEYYWKGIWYHKC